MRGGGDVEWGEWGERDASQCKANIHKIVPDGPNVPPGCRDGVGLKRRSQMLGTFGTELVVAQTEPHKHHHHIRRREGRAEANEGGKEGGKVGGNGGVEMVKKTRCQLWLADMWC